MKIALRIWTLVLITGLITPLFAYAYTIFLDIDEDNDPNTINENTGDDSATVRIVLVPTVDNEQITEISFGLGGTCLPCDYINPGWATYGTDWDLYWGGHSPRVSPTFRFGAGMCSRHQLPG